MERFSAAPWLRRLVVIGLMAGVLLLAFEILQPFVVPAVWACILCYVSWPLTARLRSWFAGRRTPAALVMTVLMTLAVIVPTLLVVLLLRTEVADGYRAVVAALSSGHGLPRGLLDLPLVGGWLEQLNQQYFTDPPALRATLQNLFNASYDKIIGVLGDVGRNLLKLAIAVVSMFFLYRDGDDFALQVQEILQKLLGDRVRDYVTAIGATVKSVLISLVLCALAQGLLAGIGYWAAGLQAPVFAAAVTTLAALIPFVVPVIWGSIVVWLFATGQTLAATGLLIWCLTAVSWIDNVIRPVVISSATRIPFLLVMFGVLGGLGAFGLVGLFVGPAILAILLAVWREWLAERGEHEAVH